MDQLIEFCLHHPYMVGTTAMLLVAVLTFELRLRSQSDYAVTTPEAVRLINNGATIVDIRPQADYDAGHVIGAVNMTAADLSRGEEGKIRKKRGILVVCQSGSESARCVDGLRRTGFEGAFSLKDGVSGWLRDNQLLVPTKR